MALSKCKECGQTVSTEAYTCPHCGAPQRAAPPPIPPTVVVQHAPEKRKGIGLFGGCLVVILAFIIIGVIGSIVSETGSMGGATSGGGGRSVDPKDAARSQIGIAEWTWHKTGFDNIMEASFTITNNSSFTIKDITIRCTHSAKSGTQIGSNTRTIYEVIEAGETKRFKDFNMGFIHSQVESSSASIKDFVIVR